MLQETRATSTKCFDMLYKDISVDLVVYTKENSLLKEGGWKELK